MNIFKYFFSSVLILFLLSGILLIVNHPGFALRVLNVTFWVVVAATYFYIRDARKDET